MRSKKSEGSPRGAHVPTPEPRCPGRNPATGTNEGGADPMAKVIAIMSMSLDGYVADANDGVAEVFDWYFSGDVEVPTVSTTSGMTFHVSAPSADHLRALMAEVGAMLTGRRTFERADGWGGQHPLMCPRSSPRTTCLTAGHGPARQ